MALVSWTLTCLLVEPGEKEFLGWEENTLYYWAIFDRTLLPCDGHKKSPYKLKLYYNSPCILRPPIFPEKRRENWKRKASYHGYIETFKF